MQTLQRHETALTQTIDPKPEVLVYALLDAGSNRTFITENTLQKLSVPTHDTNIKISTLTDIRGAESNRQSASGLLVRGYNKDKYIALPPCISQCKIPYNSEEIPNSRSVQDWPHLRHLSTEFISAREGEPLELGLLIGNNLPQVFISRQEISRGDHDPFARLTDLGWTLKGNISQPQNSNEPTHAHYSNTSKSISMSTYNKVNPFIQNSSRDHQW